MCDANTLSSPVVRSDHRMLPPGSTVNVATPVAFDPVGGTDWLPLRFAVYTALRGPTIWFESRQLVSTAADAINTRVNHFIWGPPPLDLVVMRPMAYALRKHRANAHECARTAKWRRQPVARDAPDV